MANHEQEDVSTNSGDDWLTDAIGTEGATAAPIVESAPQSTGEVPSEAVPVEVEASDAEKVTADRERDERGRFRAKSSEIPSAEADQTTQDSNPEEAGSSDPTSPQQKTSDEEDDARGHIPSWRLREEKEARRAEQKAREEAEHAARTYQAQATQFQQAVVALQQQIHQLQNPQKKPEPVDIFQDPDAFVGSWEQKLVAQEQSFHRQLRQMRLENNLSIAAMVHKEDFQPAYEAFTATVEAGDRALAQRVFASSDPGGAMVAWHREQRTLKEIGTDPNAYLERKLEEKLKDPAFLAKALEAAKAQAIGQPAASAAPGQPATRPNTVVKRPPSLSGVPGGASAHAASSSGGDWLNEALSGR